MEESVVKENVMAEDMGCQQPNHSGYYNGASNFAYQRDTEEQKKREVEDAKDFSIFGPVSFVYAIIFVFCLYKNFSGITSPLWAGASVYYMYYLCKRLNGSWKKINTFSGIIIISLGISNFITGNEEIIFLNYAAIFAVILVNVMYIFVETKGVNVTRHLYILIQILLGVLGDLPVPVRQLKCGVKINKNKKNEKVIYGIIGVCIAIPVIVIMTGLLASADEVFKNVFVDLGEMLKIDSILSNGIGIMIMVVVGFIAPYAVFVYMNKRSIVPKTEKSGNHESIIAIIVSGAVSLIYILFSGIQIVFLFIGAGTLPSGYSYAEYAREGFFQLLFVSAFNLLMIIVCIEFFKDSKILNGILTIVSICTFIMIASSAYRMGMYISEYGLTFTRVFVLWALAVITLVMLGLVYQIYKKEFNLFRYCFVIVSLCYVVLSFSHMDYFIAKYDLNMYDQMEQVHWTDNYVDYNYLLQLSTDAAPAVAEHRDEIITYLRNNEWDMDYCDWANIYSDKYSGEDKKFSVRKFNVSRFIADGIKF